MSQDINLSTVLYLCAKGQASAFVNLVDFCDYLRKYAARNQTEHPELMQYLDISESSLLKELEEYAERHELYLQNQGTGKTVIVAVSYYSIYFEERYKEILVKTNIPFPSVLDLPKNLPTDAIDKHDAAELIPALNEKQDLTSPLLYCMIFHRDIPALLFPASVPINTLLRASMAKIRTMLRKDEYHDYFQKKLRTANPNKEISARTFYTRLLQQADDAENVFELEGDGFYYWGQLCYFIRRDFEKVKDRTMEDTNILQAIAVSDIWMSSQKEKASKEKLKTEAFAELEQALAKPPFFYNMDSILKLKDSKGALLYGQYNERELSDFLTRLSSELVENELPKILIFKIASGERYFIYKNRVFPLIVRLANEAHDIIEKSLTEKWMQTLESYQTLPEMKDAKLFEKVLNREVEQQSPVLHALLTSDFLLLLHYETGHQNDGFHVFSGGKLLAYSDLLMLNNGTILTVARTKLPIWYSIPVVVAVATFFTRLKSGTLFKKVKPVQNATQPVVSDNGENAENGKKKKSRQAALANAAHTISASLVPPGSSIDRELDSYMKQWNKMLTKDGHNQLNNDVNALIRDYMRKVVTTLTASTFTQERVHSLAETLCKTPNMRKINGGDALFMYVQLYILRLVGNK